MAKADRLERLDVRRVELEAEYTTALIDALRVTASGKWGLSTIMQTAGRGKQWLPSSTIWRKSARQSTK
jgi:hypothetical protein